MDQTNTLIVDNFSFNNADFIKVIKNNLQTVQNRFNGLFLLEQSISTLNDNIFILNAPFFIKNLLKILDESHNDNERLLCFKVLISMLIKIYKINNAALNRDLSTLIMPNLIKTLIHFSLNEIPQSLNCLCIIASIFPVLISQKRKEIENKIISIVNTDNTIQITKVFENFTKKNTNFYQYCLLYSCWDFLMPNFLWLDHQ